LSSPEVRVNEPTGTLVTPPVDAPDRSRVIQLDGAFNVRDLGGLPTGRRGRTTFGHVFRGDALDELTEADERTLVGTYGLSVVIDLRAPAESGGDGHADARRFPDLQTYSYPIVPDDRIGTHAFPAGDPLAIGDLYVEYVQTRGQALAAVVEMVARSVVGGRPVLYHCAAGRDRTGVVSALLLALLGVRDTAIVDDYLASNEQAALVTARLAANPLYGAPVTPQRGLADRRSIQRLLRWFRGSYPVPADWAVEVGIPRALLADFAEVMTRGPIPSTRRQTS
jgi:protein-tyrosine phosphatase